MSNLIASYLDNNPRVIKGRAWPSERDNFLDSVKQCEAYLAAGSIPLARFKDHRHVVNRGLEIATQALWRNYDLKYDCIQKLEKAVQQFMDRIGIYDVSLNTIPNRLRQGVELIKQTRSLHPYQDEMMAFLTSASPLVGMFQKLKGMTVKREVKPFEERKPGYTPPVCSTEAQRAVVAMLEGVTQAKYDELKDALLNRILVDLRSYLERPDKTDSPSRFFKRNVSAIMATDRLVSFSRSGKLCYVPLPDHLEIAEKMATDTADEYRMSFVHKNFVKIASVIDKKNVPYEVDVVETSVSLTAMMGRFTFRFKDGSSFTVMNQVVNVVNSNGKHFLRFPLTFHDVFFSTGLKMSSPSAERMNEFFASVGGQV